MTTFVNVLHTSQWHETTGRQNHVRRGTMFLFFLLVAVAEFGQHEQLGLQQSQKGVLFLASIIVM